MNGSNPTNNKLEISYNGNSRSEKYFTRSVDGVFFKFYERFYNQDKMVKIIYFDVDGNQTSEIVRTYVGNLISKSESIVDGTIQGAIKYEYNNTTLVKREHYENGELKRYYTFSRENDTETIKGYSSQGNELHTETIKYDSYENTVYTKFVEELGYRESTNTYQYNEHGFIISKIWEYSAYNNQGTQIGIGYSKTEYKEVQCY